MQIKKLLLSIVYAVACASVFANSQDVTIAEKIKLHDMNCRTFIKLGPEYHNKVVFWATANADESKKNDVYIRINIMETVGASVVEHCNA